MERHYETIWIVRADLGPEGTKEIQDKAVEAIEKGNGHINKVDEWGVRRLAYPIKKKNEGFYTLMDFNASPATVKAMEKIFKYNEDVVRYQTVRLEEEYVEPAVETVAEPLAEPSAESLTETAPPAETATEPPAEVEAVEEKKEEGPADATE